MIGTGHPVAAPAAGFRIRDVWTPAEAVLAVLLLVGALTRQPADALRSGVGAALVMLAVLVLARVGARSILLVVALAGTGIALDAGSTANDLAWFGLCVLVFCGTLSAGRLPGAVAWAAAELLLVSNWLFAHPDVGWLPWIAGTCLSFGAALLILRERGLLAELRAAQAGLAERSRAEERNRIARDLHDVIAHSLTVSLLHVSSARLAVEHDPQEAARALAEAERLGRESLDEVRSIVGLMRDGDGSGGSGLAPARGLESLGELVEGFSGAGAEVTLAREGELARVPAIAGMTLYRIAQEALTNATKHAPGAPVTVGVAESDRRVDLVVCSAGPPGTGAGLGLSSMRERAEALGGSCETGPHDGGWRVRVSLPIRQPR